MSRIHQFTSSNWVQSGSLAEFKSGISITGSIQGKFIGDGSGLSNVLPTGVQLFFGNQLNTTPPTFESIETSTSTGTADITLSTSASGATFNHFTFLRQSATGEWEERSDYAGTQKGLASSDTLSETLEPGMYRYLLLAMSTASKQTVVTGTVVKINSG